MTGHLSPPPVKATLHVELADGTTWDIEIGPPARGDMSVVVDVHREFADMPDKTGRELVATPTGRRAVRIEATGELAQGVMAAGDEAIRWGRR